MQLEDIKKLRKKHNLNQTELANKANVSQSLIAKIESGRLDPSFTNANKIFETLENLDKASEKEIKDIMNKNIISVKPCDKIKDVIKKMKQHSISQLPVIEHNIVVGLITESNIIDKMTETKDITKLTVEDTMSEPPPTISITSSQNVASSLLKHFPMLLVTNKGKIVGIITKSDFLKII